MGNAVHVAVGGELDIGRAGRFDAALRSAWATADTIVVDLRALELIDAGGAALLTAADRRLRRAGGRLVVVRGSAEIDWLLSLFGVDQELVLVDEPPPSDPGRAAETDGVAPLRAAHAGR